MATKTRDQLRKQFSDLLCEAAKLSADSFYAKFGKLATGHGRTVRLNHTLVEGWTLRAERYRMYKVQQFPSTGVRLLNKEGVTVWHGTTMANVKSLANGLFDELNPVKDEAAYGAWLEASEVTSATSAVNPRYALEA